MACCSCVRFLLKIQPLHGEGDRRGLQRLLLAGRRRTRYERPRLQRSRLPRGPLASAGSQDEALQLVIDPVGEFEGIGGPQHALQALKAGRIKGGGVLSMRG